MNGFYCTVERYRDYAVNLDEDMDLDAEFSVAAPVTSRSRGRRAARARVNSLENEATTTEQETHGQDPQIGM